MLGNLMSSEGLAQGPYTVSVCEDAQTPFLYTLQGESSYQLATHHVPPAETQKTG